MELAALPIGQYPIRHDGEDCIICGSSPSLLNEFKVAKENMPTAKVICVNESCSAIEADMIMSLHYNRFEFFKNIAKGSGWTTHTGKAPQSIDYVNFDYYWEDCNSGATSVGMAIRIALKMGFERIVLCGAGMNGGDGYFNDGHTNRSKLGKIRFGYDKSGAINAHKVNFAEEAKKYYNGKVKSMGGYTAEVLGVPQWQQM